MTSFNPEKIALIGGVRTRYDYVSISPDFAKERNLKRLRPLGPGYPMVVHGESWRGDDRLRYFWREMEPVSNAVRKWQREQ